MVKVDAVAAVGHNQRQALCARQAHRNRLRRVAAVQHAGFCRFLAVHAHRKHNRALMPRFIVHADHRLKTSRTAVQVDVEHAVGMRADAVQIDDSAEGQGVSVDGLSGVCTAEPDRHLGQIQRLGPQAVCRRGLGRQRHGRIGSLSMKPPQQEQSGQSGSRAGAKASFSHNCYSTSVYGFCQEASRWLVRELPRQWYNAT